MYTCYTSPMLKLFNKRIELIAPNLVINSKITNCTTTQFSIVGKGVTPRKSLPGFIKNGWSLVRDS